MNSNRDGDSHLDDERAAFESWAGVEYRNSDEYTNRDFRMGLAAWQARAALAAPKGEAMDDVLNDALSNLEHDNYERSHKGYENRQADVALIRAALESTTVAGEAIQKAKHDTANAETERERVMALAYWLDQQTFEPGMLSCAAATLRAMFDRDTAPQASEAVRNVVARVREWATEKNVKEFPRTACAHIEGLAKLLLASGQRTFVDLNHPIFAFLLGEGTLRGVEFGGPHPEERGAYWWRKDLRAALASAPVADRQRLRELVDVVWNEATNSTAVPSTPWADRMIDKVFPSLAANTPVAGAAQKPARWMMVERRMHSEPEYTQADPSGIYESVYVPLYAAPQASAEAAAAVRTLTAKGYTWCGGEQWKPPLGDSNATLKRLAASDALEVARAALMEIADLADVEADQRGVIVNQALTKIDKLTAAPQASPASDGRDAAFEAVRKRFCKLPRSSFVVGPKPFGGVQRVDDTSGRWVEFDAVHELFDPVAVDAAIAAQQGEGGGV